MKSNKNKIIMSLLVLGMLFSLVTANTLSANENEDIEVTEEIVEEDATVELTLDEVIQEDIEDSSISTMSDTIAPYAITDSVFSDSSRPLEQAIIANYDGTNGTTKIDTDGDGYISASEAAAYTGYLWLQNLGITGTIDGIEYFTSTRQLYLQNNNLTGTIPAGITNMTSLQYLHLSNNDFTGSLPSDMSTMTSLVYLYYSGTNLTGDISSIPNLKWVGVNYASGITGTNIVRFATRYNTGGATDSEVSLEGTAGFLSYDSASGYYVIAPGLAVTYRLKLQCQDADGNWNYGEAANFDLSAGGLMDHEGNLIIGATLSDINPDGSITMTDGVTVVTGNTTYHFDGETTLNGMNASTTGNVSIDNYTVTPDAGGAYVGSADISNSQEIVTKDETTISMGSGSSLLLEPGTILNNNAGDKVYVIDGGTLYADGTISATDVMITVPSGSVSSITTSGDEDTLPAGTSVTVNGETVTYPGTIIIDTVENTVTYLPVDSLFDETGTGLATGITQQDIDDALTLVNTITPGALQDELLAKIADAQSMMDAKTKAEGLLNSSQDDLANGIDQNAITNAGNAVSDLVDGAFKDALQSLVDKAQTILNAITAVDDLYNADKSDLVVNVTQDMIDKAQDAVDKLDPNSDKAKELQELIDKAQTILDNREAATKAVDDLFNDKKDNLASGITQGDINDAQDLVNKLPDGEYKDNLQKEINTAQDMLDAKEAVENLFNDKKDNLAEGVTQEDIDNAQDLVNKLPEGELKNELQKEINKAQAMQDAKDAAGNLLDENGNLKDGVTQEDIDNAQDLVNKLPDGELKDQLQSIIDEAQKQLDEKNASTSKPSTAPNTTVKPSVDSTSTTGGSSVNTSDETNMTLYIGLFVMSLAGVVLVVRKRKIEE